MSLMQFEGELIHETDSAYLIDLGVHNEEDGDEGTWIAKCMMHNVDEYPKTLQTANGEVEVDWISFEISDKIALNKGII